MIFAPDGKTLRRLLSRPGLPRAGYYFTTKGVAGGTAHRTGMQGSPFGDAKQAVQQGGTGRFAAATRGCCN